MALVIAEGPQLETEERKRSMIVELTEVAAKYLAVDPRNIVVLIREEGGDRMALGKGDSLGWGGEPARRT